MKPIFPFIPQKSHDGCAIAVLTMLSNYFGVNLKYLEVEAYFIDKNLTFKDMLSYLESKKIQAFAYSLSSKDISLIKNFPIVLHYQNHFVIVYKREADLLVVADPAGSGLKKIHFLKIRKQWSGNYLDLSLNEIMPISNIEKHLPYNLRLFILNLIILFIIMIFIK